MNMKRTMVLLLMTGAVAAPARAAGLLQPRDSSLPPLQIQDHTVNVVINNGFAVTEVDQVFFNPSDRDLEAIYTFPLPRDAALSELSLWIDGREVVGEVVERERATAIYEQERAAGRDTAVAEQRSYVAFDVLVSPVRARQQTRVRLVYLQPLEIDTGVGRYVYPLEEGRIDEEVHSFWDLKPEVHGRFAFQCTLRSTYPVDDVRAKGYEQLATVTQSDPETWTVWIEETEGSTALGQDVVVYYRLAPDQPARVDLLAHRAGDGPGTFLMVITPGMDLKPIDEGVDWTIVLDVSGSMAGKIATAAGAIGRAMDTLRPQDRFRIITFSDRARELVSWTAVSPDSVDHARRKLMARKSEGGTNLYDGLLKGLEGLDADRTSAVILVSDGGANVGPTEHADFLRLLDRQDVRVLTFVMGQGANQPLLGRLADESGGFSMDVSNQDDLYGRILQARQKLGREALHGLRLEMDGVAVADLAPARLPAAYHGQQIRLLGRYERPGEATLRLSGRISGQERQWETRVTLPEVSGLYPELERMWALGRIQELQKRLADGGQESELRPAIVDLGTSYSIVSEHTSMIVVQEEQFAAHGLDRRNRDRVEGERLARITRVQQAAAPTRADARQPMFGGRSAPGLGGGASGPGLVALLLGLLGITLLTGRRPGL